MWNQWTGVAAAAPMPPIPAPQCPPPQPPPPSVAPPPPAAAPLPALTEPTTGNIATPIIGPMLPSAATPSTLVAPPTSTGPYGQYTEAQYAALTPEQQYALQQHWQQWQAYQQEYAKWHAQYGEQYKREMAAAAATGQTMNLNNYYQQVQPQPHIQTQPPQQHAPQQHTAHQPPPPPPPDSQQANAKFPGAPQIYTQPPPPQLQPHQMPHTQPMPVNQGPPTIHQPPPGGPFQNMNYPQWQQAYPQPQPQQQFNYNQPPPSFSQQPPNFGQIPNFQQPPPMASQPQTQCQPQMPTAPQGMKQKSMHPYGSSNQTNSSGNNESGGNNNKSQPNVDRNFERNLNVSSGPNPNLWGNNSNQHDNEYNKRPMGNNSLWHSKQDNLDTNFGGNQYGPNERGQNNWDSRKDDRGDSNDYNDLSNDGNMNDPFESNLNSRDGFENTKTNSNNRWSGEKSNLGPRINENRNGNFIQGRQGPQGGSNQWNNNNRNPGRLNMPWKDSPYDSQEPFDDDRRNTGTFNNQRNQSGPNDQSGGNRWANNSGQWPTNDSNDRDSGFNNNFNQGPRGSGRNFDGNNFMHGPNNNFNRRFGQNERNFGGNFNQRSGGNGGDYGSNDPSNRRFGGNERNFGPNNVLDEGADDSCTEYKDTNMRPSSSDRNFGNRNNFNKWSESNDNNCVPRNNFNASPEGGNKNSNPQNPFNSRSRSNERNFGTGGNGDNFGPNTNFNQPSRGNGRNFGHNNNFNRRPDTSDFGPNSLNQKTDSNEPNFGQCNLNQRSNSNERNIDPNSNFNRRSNSNERIREPVSNIGAIGQVERKQPESEYNAQNSQNQDTRDSEVKNEVQVRPEMDTGNQQQRPDLDEKKFDLQFQRWEEQFDQWKRANANHPDREMYRRYEQEFEKQRQRIMERREQMRLRKLQQMGIAEESLGNKSGDKLESIGNKPPTETQINTRSENGDIVAISAEQFEGDEDSNQPMLSEEKTTIDEMEIKATKESEGMVETAQKKLEHEMENTESEETKVDNPDINKELPGNMELSNVEKKISISFGKRKSRFSAPKDENVKMSKPAEPAVSEVISLVDEEENNPSDVPGSMCNIFGKSEGIPGLDLVESATVSDSVFADNPSMNKENKGVDDEIPGLSKQAQQEIQNPCGKIPSLFDVVVEKPADFPMQSPICENDEGANDDNDICGENIQEEKAPEEQLIHPNISNAIPNLGDALRDPVFMQKISQALAKAQGRESADPSCAPPPQFLQQLPMLLQQLQQPKPVSDNSDGNLPSFGGNGQNYGGNDPNLDENGPNFGRNAPNYGGYGPNCGGSLQNFGRHFPNYGGNGPNFGDNGQNRPNFGGNGTNFRGPNFGFNGPNGGNGPSGPNGPNFNRNGPNFNRFGPSGPNFRAGNGANFQGDGPNFRCGNGPNFGVDGNGQNFGRNAPNDDRHNFGRYNNMADRGRQDSFRGGGGNANCGPEGKGAGGGFNATGTDNSNSSWVDGPGNSGDYGDDFYRPVQVIDYHNTTISRPKVIDYGHKGASACASAAPDSDSRSNPFNTNVSSFSHEFKPVQTFDYGHSSNSAANKISSMPSFVNPKKKNKKRKKKTAAAAQQNRIAPQAYGIQSASILQQQQDTFEADDQNEDENSQQSANPTGTLNSNVSSPRAANEELEEISDNEDDLENNRDNDSPAPPPPPMLTTNKPYIMCSVQCDATAPTQSLFPSTAAANENIAEGPSGHVQMSFPSIENKNTITVDEILLNPGRLTRPKKVCVILRGPPGSGKSHVAKLIKEKETAMGGSNPRVLSIDDYFLIENDYVERCPKTGKKIPKKEVLYEYDAEMEETYMQYMIKSFKKTISDNLYDFIIVDCNNNSLRTLNEFYCHSKDSDFMPYIVDLICDVETCLSRNTHERSEKQIKAIIDTWKPTPLHYIKLDVASLLENLVEMEDAEDMVMDNNSNSGAPDDSNLTQPQADNETEDSNDAADTTISFGFLESKWENDTTSENLARLDGTNRLMQKRKAATMEDYLQMDDWQPPKTSTNGKKRVRWADIEEKRAQEKMRAIGFVVGQTDWKRMMDPNAGSRALNKTKYIERVKKRR